MKIKFLLLLILISATSLFAQNNFTAYEYDFETEISTIMDIPLPDMDVNYFSYNNSICYFYDNSIFEYENNIWMKIHTFSELFIFVSSTADRIILKSVSNELFNFDGLELEKMDVSIDFETKDSFIYEGINILGADNSIYLVDYDYFLPIDLLLPDSSTQIFELNGIPYLLAKDNYVFSLDDESWVKGSSLFPDNNIYEIFNHAQKTIIIIKE